MIFNSLGVDGRLPQSGNQSLLEAGVLEAGFSAGFAAGLSVEVLADSDEDDDPADVDLEEELDPRLSVL